MKKRLGTILIFTAVLMMLTGCSIKDFFDVRSTMSPPSLSDEHAEIENSLINYIGDDFKLLCPMIDGKYSSVLKCNIDGSEYMIIFCETEDRFVQSHCVFFEKESEKWAIKDDIVEGNFKIRSACVRDVNCDGVDEIIIEGTDTNNSNVKTYIYQIRKNGIVSIR